jgi:hypothetical protein
MAIAHNVIFTEASSFLLTFLGPADRRNGTLLLLDTENPETEEHLGSQPWLVTGIATLEQGHMCCMTLANPITGAETPMVTSRVLKILPVQSVPEAMVEAVLARV